ncbi:MAG: LCP family protein [Patescibacteria group bacterium]
MINKLKNIITTKKSFLKRFSFFVFIFLFLFVIFIFLKAGYTFSLISSDYTFWQSSIDDGYEERDRIDILILGMRGDDDVQYGGTLTDSIMILSIDTKNNKTAFISIPRDLYTKIPRHDNKREKINFAYAFGENKKIGGLNISKDVIESITGIVIDYAVAIDFKTFENLIDVVGGIDVYLNKEFTEASQWGFEFTIPAGKNTIDGKTALYYARSRFSTDDFDRSRRQQDVLVSLKNKLLNTGVLVNPLKINEIFNSIGKGVKTNIDFTTSLRLIKYIKYMDSAHLTRKIIDASENGLLQAGKIDDSYVLYPKIGLDNFTDIKEEIRGIFKQ